VKATHDGVLRLPWSLAMTLMRLFSSEDLEESFT
jgi:hypothetical protein